MNRKVIAGSWQAPSVTASTASRSGRPTEGAVTLDEGLARFDCTLYREVEAGDHLIVLLRLHAVDHPETGSPLIFHRSGFGRLAETA